MAEMLVPTAVVLRESDLAFLRSALEALPPLERSLLMTLNGWTDEMLALGRLLGSVVDLMRSGDLELGRD